MPSHIVGSLDFAMETPEQVSLRLSLQHVREGARIALQHGDQVDPVMASQANDNYRRLRVLQRLEPQDYIDWSNLMAVTSRGVIALDVVNSVVTDFPGDRGVEDLALEQLCRLGDLAAAHQRLREIMVRPIAAEADVVSALASLERVISASGMRRDAPVLGDFQALVSKAKAARWPDALLAATEILMVLDEAEQAEACLAALPDSHSSSDHAEFLRARIAVTQERHYAALRLLLGLEPERRDSVFGALLQAEEFRLVGELERARSILESLHGWAARGGEVGLWIYIANAGVTYNQGDYARYWTMIKTVAGLSDAMTGTGTGAVATVLRCRMRVVPPQQAEDLGRRLRGLVLDSVDDELSLSYVEDLAWAADRWGTASLRQSAELAARELVMRFQRATDSRADTDKLCAAMAYLGVLSRSEEVTRQALRRLSPAARHDWRNRLLQAFLDQRSDPIKAARDLRVLHAERPYELDLRSAMVQATLLAGDVQTALTEAADLVRFAPGHVNARVLLAEATLRLAEQQRTVPAKRDVSESPAQVPGMAALGSWFRQATTASKEAGETSSPHRKAGALLYADSVRNFASVARQHRSLAASVATSGALTDPAQCSSDFLPVDTRIRVYRRGLYAVIRCRDGLSASELRGSLAMRAEMSELLNGLVVLDPVNAQHLGHALARQSRRVYGRVVSRVLSICVAALFALLAVWPRLIPFHPEDPEGLRLILFGVSGAALLWPYVRKFSFAGIDVEKIAVLSEPDIDPVIELDWRSLPPSVVRPARIDDREGSRSSPLTGAGQAGDASEEAERGAQTLPQDKGSGGKGSEPPSQ